MSKLLIDTNVLIYFKDSSSIHHKASANLLTGRGQFFITSKNLSEYYSVVTKGDNPFLTSTEALQDLDEFISNFDVLYPTDASYQKN